MSWSTLESARQYVKFEDERTRPVRDLVAAIPARETRAAIDLGCGPGNSTEVLAARFPDAGIRGLDSSPDMIEAARKRLPGHEFVLGDIETWAGSERYDVILANASLQWVPNHAALYPRLAGRLAEGGSLAVQTPDNWEEPAHLMIRKVASSGPWASRVADAGRERRDGAEWYYSLLKPHCAHVDVWRTTYYHPLAGAGAVVEWFRGSALRPYLALLSEAEQADFLGRYQQEIAQAYPAQPDGVVLLPFPRLFIVATR
jgi:trans-aconitate 2-methyltransferase